MKGALLPDLSYDTSVVKTELHCLADRSQGKVVQLRHSNDQIINEHMKVREVQDTN
jgi:uncharacterized protein YcnI